MFICASCGYEGNPDSSPACSLCGAKKGGGGGGDRPSNAAKLKAAGDELAAAAKLVAEDDAPAPPPAKASGAKQAAPKRRPEAGVIRVDAAPPLLGSATAITFAFLGGVLAYVADWARLGHAPSGWTDAFMVLGGIALFALVGRVLVAGMLENRLRGETAETFAGIAPGVSALGLFVLLCVGFFAATPAAGPAPGGNDKNPTEIDGGTLASRLALLTPLSVQSRGPKGVDLAEKGKKHVHVPPGKLKKSDLDELEKATGLAPAKWALCVSADPWGELGANLPPEFQLDLFLSRLSDGFKVRPDPTAKTEKTPTGLKKVALVRTRAHGGVETLWTIERPATVGDIASALPEGVPKWIGVALGLPHESGSEQDAFLADLLGKLPLNEGQ